MNNPDYDLELAERLGADDYGMKKYILVILKDGSNKTKDTDFINTCFSAHLKNIRRLSAENKITIAGPLAKNEHKFRGIFVLNVTTISEAEELLQSDLAIKNQLLEADCFEWYGSAALPLYLSEHDKIWKQQP